MTSAPVKTKPSRLCYRAVEFRAQTPVQGDGRTLEGYAAVFGQATEIDSWEGCFQEVIAKGAFKRTINAKMPVLQFDHGRDARTGTVPIGAIQTLREDATGLYVSARLFDNEVVEPIRQAIEGKAIDGMSFRFKVVRDVWTDANGKTVDGTELLDLLWMPGDRGPLTRTIQEVELFELGPVVFPAYEATTVGVRSMLAELNAEERAALVRDLANELRPPATDDAEPAPQRDTSDDDDPDDEDEPDDPDDPETAGRSQEPANRGTSAPPSTSAPERTQAMTDDRMTVEERATRQDEIRARLTEIDTDHSGSTLPADVQAEWDSLNTELDEHTRAIEAATERRERLRALGERQANSGGGERVGGTGLSGARSGVPVRRPENIYDLAELRHQARSIDELPQLMRDNARRSIEQAVFPGVENREAAQEKVERLLATVDDPSGTLAKRLLVTGSPVYSRAFGKALAHQSTDSLTTEERAALAVGADANGGYAVPYQLDPTVVLTSDGAINPLRQMARVERIVGKEWQGVTSAGITVSRAAEGAEVGDNGPTFSQPAVRAERVQGFVPFSIEIEQDWNALQSEMTRLLADAKDVEEATSFVTGDGTGTNAGGLVGTLAAGSVVRTNGGTVGTASFDVGDIYALKNALPPRFRARGQFLGETAIYDEVRQFDVYGGSSLWVQLQDATPPRLIGYPAREISTMDSAVANDAKILVFGDFRQFLIVDRIGMSVELVPHLFGTANNRPTGQRGLYAIWRNNSVILTSAAFRLLQVNAAT